MNKLHEVRHWKSVFFTYTIYEDHVEIPTLVGYRFVIPFADIKSVDMGQPPVIWDLIKKGKFTLEYAYGLRVIKNDLADFFRHVSIEKKTGFWKQIRITPRDPEAFQKILKDAIDKNKVKAPRIA